MQARDWPGAVDAARQLIAVSPSSESLRMLADAQLNTGAYQESLASYGRALAASDAEKPGAGQTPGDWKDGIAKIWVGKGNALLKLQRTDDAIEAYNRAAGLSSSPGKAYFNVCAVLYNNGKVHEAAAACRTSLQADSTLANAWFVLGSCLFTDATTDGKGKFVITAETRQALERYLELAPDGAHAVDVKAMLDATAK
jgi:tetratricopeptide (TPR) repeat protein